MSAARLLQSGAIRTDLVLSSDETDRPAEIVQVWCLADIGNITQRIICKQEFALQFIFYKLNEKDKKCKIIKLRILVFIVHILL